jgi:hypothetical protein
MRSKVFLFENSNRLQVGQFDIAGIFQNQSLGTITHDHPFAVSNQKRHRPLLEFTDGSTRQATELLLGINAASLPLLPNFGFATSSVRAIQQTPRNDLSLDFRSAFKNIEDSRIA